MKRLLILVLIILTIFSLLCSCKKINGTHNEIISIQFSPNKEYKIIVFNRNINSTTGYNYQASILKYNEELLDTTGNVLITHSEIACEWLSDTEVQIYLNKDKQIFKNQEQFEDISIKYNFID